MATKPGDVVVRLDTHPAWRASDRRSREFEEAMRRHPSYQSRTLAPPLRVV
ncbi:MULTISPECIES: hypothetical protein [Mycolicibacterium]|uniref:hypothetical protein n=1 Tax=Mycolicibacterium TaxID=1866885 RepID=UPI00130174AC|nr:MULTISPECIES: hypothetical protein [Mycolicibacterium]MBV5242391.1 hypothetical protein [Mycolicibacterium sp. PAM1]